MTQDQILIREASTDDTASLTSLMNSLGYPTTYEEMQQRFDHIIDHPDYKTFLAIIGGQVAGMAGTTQNYFYEQNSKYVRIVALVTDARFRKQGVAKKLLETVERWAKESGAASVLLNCGNREEREQAHVFYKNRGYEVKSSGYVKKLVP